jgi:hypothetical protein
MAGDGGADYERAMAGKKLGSRWGTQFESCLVRQAGRIWALEGDVFDSVKAWQLS